MNPPQHLVDQIRDTLRRLSVADQMNAALRAELAKVRARAEAYAGALSWLAEVRDLRPRHTSRIRTQPARWRGFARKDRVQ